MVGRQIGRYTVLEQIGSGGMSVVYLARDPKLDRDVALKQLHPHLAAKEDSRRRFSREARAVAKLHHPNILEIFDFSDDEAQDAFIVTEYIQGATLRHYAEEHRFHPPEIAAMAVHELASALEHAHANGVIHRDLKPENVMIRKDGVIKLMDFGIAKVLDRDERMTVTGALVGSPAHMAPEIIEGQEAGKEADIFSLGTILYWLCCRRLPFLGNNTTQTLKLVLDGDYPDPRLENPAVSDDIAAVIARCLAREPAARYASATELKEALGKVLLTCHVEHVADELAAYFADPEGFSARFQAKLVAQLLDEAHGYTRPPGRNYARALDRLNRVLALEPGNARAKQLIESTKRRRQRVQQLKLAGKGLAVLLMMAAAGFGAYRGLVAVQELRAAQVVVPPPAPVPVPEPVVVAPVIEPVRHPDPVPDPVPKPKPDHRPRDPKKPKDVALVRPDPVPEPPAPPEVREVTLNLEPQSFAWIRVDDLAERRAQTWTGPLAVGDHLVRLRCDFCVDEPIPLKVPSSKDQPVLRPLEVRMRLKAPAVLEVDDPASIATVNGRSMVPATDNPRRRTLDIPLPAGRDSARVVVELRREGQPPRTWNQDVFAGRTNTLRAP